MTAKTYKPAREVLKRSTELKKKKTIGKIILLVVVFLIIVGGIIYAFYSSNFEIKEIEVSGYEVLAEDDLQDWINQELSGNYLWVFSKRNIFLYPKRHLIQGLLANFPRLSGVEVNLNSWNRLSVHITERDVRTVWCDSYDKLVSEVSSSTSAITDWRQCFFADEKGVVFAEAPYFSDNIFVELDGLLPERPLGDQPLPLSKYQQVVRLADNLPKVFFQTGNNHYRLKNITLLDESNYAALIIDQTNSSSTSSTWAIYFNYELSADELASNLFSVLNSSSFKKDFQDSDGKIYRIDLRYGQKVFYEFK